MGIGLSIYTQILLQYQSRIWDKCTHLPRGIRFMANLYFLAVFVCRLAPWLDPKDLFNERFSYI